MADHDVHMSLKKQSVLGRGMTTSMHTRYALQLQPPHVAFL
jgi:hypothetical protein